MTDWLPPLLEKLDRLCAADPAFLVTGASEHRYRFGPKCPEAWLTFCEHRYDIRLPEQFRRFISAVGNGGCGPWHGLQRFGYLPTASLIPGTIWTGESSTVETEWNFTRTEPIDFLPDGTPTDGFETRFFGVMLALAGGDTILAEPFPFAVDAVPDEDMWGGLAPARDRCPVPGAWNVAHYGCGIDHALVLNGPRAGEVWSIDFANDTGARRIAGSFAEWYDGWLEHSLRFCARSFNYRRILSVFATNDREEAEALAARFAAAGLWWEIEGSSSRTVTVHVKVDVADEARRILAEFEDAKRNGR